MRTLPYVAGILLCACGPTMQSDGDPATDVRLTVQPATAAAGDSVVLTLDNATAGQIGYNLCASSLERQTASGWEVVPSDVVCTMELRTLEGNQQASYRTVLPDNVTAGQHRYMTSIEDLQTNSRHAVRSTAFRVTS